MTPVDNIIVTSDTLPTVLTVEPTDGIEAAHTVDPTPHDLEADTAEDAGTTPSIVSDDIGIVTISFRG